MILEGDCLEVMPTLDAESVDAVVTDPPYGLEFMGKSWDRLGDIGRTSHSGPKERDNSSPYGRTRVSYSGSTNKRCRTCGHWAYSGTPCTCEKPDFPDVRRHQAVLMGEWHERWATEAFRLAKPSAYLLAFGGTRTVHRMACAIEDAGWLIRDMLVWAYASGFPKSKASLKPAWEPIVMARKPGPLRELAIDACRIGWADDADRAYAETVGSYPKRKGPTGNDGGHFTDDAYIWPGQEYRAPTAGRWPANVILTDPIFDGGWDGVVGGGTASDGGAPTDVRGRGGIWHDGDGVPAGPQYGDSGTYSRFFLIPKADRAEREPLITPDGHDPATRFTTHPTIKPLELMRHLMRLVTPTGGTILDPFLGSGTTGIAAEMEGFRWLGIEREPEYVRIAEARLHGTQKGLGLPA